MAKKAVSSEMAERIFELRQEVDGWGDPVWGCGELAQQFGVSESTIWRVLAKRAAYAGRDLRMEKKKMEAQWEALGKDAFRAEGREIPELDAQAAASEEKFRKMLAGEVEIKRLPSHAITPQSVRDRAAAYLDPKVELAPARASGRVIPLSPLEGGDGGADETQGEGLKALGERTLADDKARGAGAGGNNASGLCGDNANELLKELS